MGNEEKKVGNRCKGLVEPLLLIIPIHSNAKICALDYSTVSNKVA